MGGSGCDGGWGGEPPLGGVDGGEGGRAPKLQRESFAASALSRHGAWGSLSPRLTATAARKRSDGSKRSVVPLKLTPLFLYPFIQCYGRKKAVQGTHMSNQLPHASPKRLDLSIIIFRINRRRFLPSNITTGRKGTLSSTYPGAARTIYFFLNKKVIIKKIQTNKTVPL